MSAVVIPFGSGQQRQRSQGWRPDEIAEVYRVVDLLGRTGVAVSIDSGRTDEGDPWLVVLRDDTEDVVVHIARIDHKVVVASTASERVFSGPTLAETLRRVVGTEILVLPKGGALYLHPAALLAAFIATALTHATAGDTTGTNSGVPERSRTSPVDVVTVHQADTNQQSADPLPTPSRYDTPAFPQSVLATAVATVVLSVSIVGDDQFAQVTRDFLEALKATAPASPPSQQPEDQTGRTDYADGNAPEPLDGELGAVDVTGREAPLQQTLAEGSGEVSDTGVTLVRWFDLGTPRVDLQQTLTHDTLSGMDHPWLSTSEATGDVIARQQTAEGPMPALDPTAGLAAKLLGSSVAVSSSPVALRLSPASSVEGESSHVSDHPTPLLELSQFSFFRSGIENLGVFRFEDFKGAQVTDVHEDRAHPPVQGTFGGSGVPPTSPVGPESPGGGRTVIPYEASVETKALALSEFAFGSAHEVHVQPGVLASVRDRIVSNSFLEGVDRVIVFDAPSASADAFMLMPGVAMLRSNLAHDVIQPYAAPSVEFALSDGSTLRLLGMIDI